jgi:hypothetical protein
MQVEEERRMQVGEEHRKTAVVVLQKMAEEEG